MININNYILEKFKIKKGISLLSEDCIKLISVMEEKDTKVAEILKDFIIKNDIKIFKAYFPHEIQYNCFKRDMNGNRFLESSATSIDNDKFNDLRKEIFLDNWRDLNSFKIYSNTNYNHHYNVVYYRKGAKGILIETYDYFILIVKD